MTKPQSSAASAGGSQPRRRKGKKLAPSQKYEVFTRIVHDWSGDTTCRVAKVPVL